MTGALQIVNENTIRLEDELEVSSDSRLCKFDYFNLRARAHSIEASDSKKNCSQRLGSISAYDEKFKSAGVFSNSNDQVRLHVVFPSSVTRHASLGLEELELCTHICGPNTSTDFLLDT